MKKHLFVWLCTLYFGCFLCFSVTYGHFNDLDWCIVQAATIGQCIQSELEDINQQRTYLFGNLPNCPNEGNYEDVFIWEFQFSVTNQMS